VAMVVEAAVAATAGDVMVLAAASGPEASPTSPGAPATGTARPARPTTLVRLLISSVPS